MMDILTVSYFVSVWAYRCCQPCLPNVQLYLDLLCLLKACLCLSLETSLSPVATTAWLPLTVNLGYLKMGDVLKIRKSDNVLKTGTFKDSALWFIKVNNLTLFQRNSWMWFEASVTFLKQSLFLKRVCVDKAGDEQLVYFMFSPDSLLSKSCWNGGQIPAQSFGKRS